MASTSLYYVSVPICTQIIQELLTSKPEFNEFSRAPYLLKVMLGTFEYESSWRPYFPGGSGYTTSGSTPGKSGPGTLAAQFLNSPEIINLANLAKQNPTTYGPVYQQVLLDYNYPHSLGQVMGSYHYTNNDAFRSLPSKFQTGLINMGVAKSPFAPGSLLSTVYTPTTLDPSAGAPIPTQTALTRAIYASMAIMAWKYEAYLRGGDSPAKAITKAAGAYVGKGADLNGMTPELRIAQIFGPNPPSGPSKSYIGPGSSGTMTASSSTTPSSANGAASDPSSSATDCAT